MNNYKSDNQSLLLLLILFRSVLFIDCLLSHKFFEVHQFFKADINLFNHLIAFFLFSLELSAKDIVFSLHLSHTLLVLSCYLHYLLNRHCILGCSVLIVNANHPHNFLLQLLRLFLVIICQLCSLQTNLIEMLKVLRCQLLLVLALHLIQKYILWNIQYKDNHRFENNAILLRIFYLPIISQARAILGPLLLPETIKRSMW